jgi:intracellular sulfur oxidation DsrE/DsrF family protein
MNERRPVKKDIAGIVGRIHRPIKLACPTATLVPEAGPHIIPHLHARRMGRFSRATWRRDVAKNANRRRQLLAGIGTTAAAMAVGTGTAAGQTPAISFQPARHAEDEWFATRPGKHRVILDTVSVAGVEDAVRFANNLFNGSKSGYRVDEADMAIVVCLRHRATPHAYTDALWSKYGRVLDRRDENPEASGPMPTANRYDTAGRTQLSDLAKRGAHFMVCGTASRGIAQRAAGPNGNVDAVFKELEATLIPNGHIVAAGVVGVTHAQEYGYSYLYVG